jgi:hypothetical protein
MLTSGRRDARPAAGLALLAELRASLLERCSLIAHEVLAPEGVPFSRVRAGCEQALEALERSLRDPHRAPFSSLVLEREVAGCIQAGLSFIALVGALQRAFVELGRRRSRRGFQVLGAAGGVLERVSTAAAAELDHASRIVAAACRHARPRARGCEPAGGRRSIWTACSMRSAAPPRVSRATGPPSPCVSRTAAS